jgi:CDP-diacylglycerol pyrophosphatase
VYWNSRRRLGRLSIAGAWGVFGTFLTGLAAALGWAQPPQAQTKVPGYTAAVCTLAPKPDTLWSLAQCCAADVNSSPSCIEYDKENKFVIVKDNAATKPVAYLIIPSLKVTGIEDTHVFAAPVVDFWRYGWQIAPDHLRKPAANTGLAINSVEARGQNQLHIHISCVLPAVAKTLAQNDAKIGSDPTRALQLPLGPHNNPYEVVKVGALNGSSSPFNVVAAIPHAKGHMGDQSIAVIGAQTGGIYYVLDTYYVKGSNPGSAEELLDQRCTG